MSTPHDTEATDTHPPAKIFGHRRADLPERDLSNPGEVYLLAHEATTASNRLLMRISLTELRAIASFAVWAGAVAVRFIEALEMSDANAPPEQLVSALKKAAETARNGN